ncbi:MAG: phosphatidylinositol-3-phosphatase [Gaiellaceae bacterium]|nr:phosphatidylinositol-3-phosphatase [Gaiellaceae bacterium]
MKYFMATLVLSLVLAAPAASVVAPVPALGHVIVVVFENKETTSVLGNRAAPTFNAYARRYARLTRYYGVTHPSLPNYLALVSGSTHGITNDCTTCTVTAQSLADTLEAAGKTWKTYAEGLPSPGFLGGSYRRYAKKHNPFAYFQDIAASPSRRANMVPLPRLATDLRAGSLPDFSLVVPDLCHSMHDCSVAVGDAWLKRTVAPMLKLPSTAVLVLFDEGSTGLRGGGHTPALAVGTAVRPGSAFTRVTNHYGALRTIEQALGLPALGRSSGARPITGIWR